MGILERIEEKLDLLLQSKSPVAISVEEALKPVVGETPVGSDAEVTPAGVSINGTIELDAENCPWDSRIHAGTKTKTAKGIWKARKGADKDEVAKIKAELIAANAGSTPPAADVPPTTSATPPPTATVSATPPPTTGATPPPAVNPANEFKGKAIAEFNRLDKDFGVPFDSTVEVLEQFDGAKMFDQLKPEHYEGAWVALKAYADWLQCCTTEIEGITVVLGDAAPERVASICANWGVSTIAEVHYQECNELHDKLKEDRAVLEAWKASQG